MVSEDTRGHSDGDQGETVDKLEDAFSTSQSRGGGEEADKMLFVD